MHVVVHVLPNELGALVRLLEGAAFPVAIVPRDGTGGADADADAEVELVVGPQDRAGPGDRLGRYVIGDLVVDLDARVVHAGGCRIELTSREFDLLVTFARNSNRVLSKRMLVDLVWATEPVTPNAVEVRVSALRRKLSGANGELIQTVRGAGYVFRTTAVEATGRGTGPG